MRHEPFFFIKLNRIVSNPGIHYGPETFKVNILSVQISIDPMTRSFRAKKISIWPRKSLRAREEGVKIQTKRRKSSEIGIANWYWCRFRTIPI
jgi:hypothetical protein